MRNSILQLQSNAVQSRQSSVDSRYRIQWRSWTECRVQNNGTLHGVCKNEGATDETFHDVSLQNWKDPLTELSRLAEELNSKYREQIEFDVPRTNSVRRTRKIEFDVHKKTYGAALLFGHDMETVHLIFFQQLHEELRKENMRATVRRGVCMKSNIQRKGHVTKSKWAAPKIHLPPPQV